MTFAEDLRGVRVVITGANTGIGRVTALRLAERGARMVLAGRSCERTWPVIEQIRSTGGSAEFVPLDLASFASVRSAATTILDDPSPIALLINNAGVAGRSGITKEGFELAFGVNHLGHFLLTRLLIERLQASSPSRIVVVTSEMHRDVETLDWSAVRGPAPRRALLAAYRISKLANVLFVRQLAECLDGRLVTAVAVHPGLVASDIWRHVPPLLRWFMARRMLSPEEGAEAVVHVATSPEIESGGYYARTKRRPPSVHAELTLAAELWERSARWTGSEEGDRNIDHPV